ncbi:MAG: sporulation initiation factor Spo0A C-terminal domain-containing protein [Clostridia bacterium]|nr:sporulation initiation factor Spo0A C-terminal domain-containing protein [Clostridia bacterium]MDO4356214.1 sporulation initiation factor Spo0A C-terminal domain-containing protein [Clostridia bacterium]
MRKLRILLADHTQQQLDYLYDCISSDPTFEIVGACADGQQAFNLARAAQPDMIVCDVILPVLDGLNLLERFVHTQIRPMFIFTSSLSNDLVAQQVSLLGAEYFLLKPFKAKRLCEIIHMSADSHLSRDQKLAGNDPQHEIYRLLISHGFISHIHGFQYLATGVLLAHRNPALLNNLSKELYVQIADRHHTSAARVERDIRHAIVTTCTRTGSSHITNGMMLRHLVSELSGLIEERRGS